MLDVRQFDQARLLYVDDEEQSLKYFRRYFERDFDIATAISGDEALRILARPGKPVGVVISDQRMPGMVGTTLLATVRQRYPDVVRILTTAYAELDSAIAAVNEGAVWHYCVKPWRLPELGVSLRQAVEHFLISRDRRLLLEEKVQSLQRFIVNDRVRSYAILANGLASRIRNPLLALKSFIDCAPFPRAVELADGSVEWRELLGMAKEVSARTLEIIHGVVDSTVSPRLEFVPLDLAALLDRVIEDGDAWNRQDVTVVACIDVEDTMLNGDERLLRELFLALLRRLSALIGRGRTVVLDCREVLIRDEPGLELRLHSPDGSFAEDDWRRCFGPVSDPAAGTAEMDLLTAFFIAFHHGGQVEIDRGEAGSDAGFTVRLPRAATVADLPASDGGWQQRIFTHFPAIVAGT